MCGAHFFTTLNKILTGSIQLKGLRQEHFALLGQFCALLSACIHTQNAPVKLCGRYQMNFIRES